MDRKTWYCPAIAMVLVMALSGAAFSATPGNRRTDVVPMAIINDDYQRSEISMWAFSREADLEWLPCQTATWSSANAIFIFPDTEPDAGRQLDHDHCGNYNTLWFRLWVRDKATGQVISEIETRDYNTRWGGSWTWNGVEWRCMVCLGG